MKFFEKNLLTNENIVMVVNSCDAYQDVLPMFFCALDEYWPSRSFNVVINSESNLDKIKEKNTSLHTVDNKNNYKWGSRFLETLDDIQTEYIIMVYDDYILESTVNVEQLNNIVGFMDENPNTAAVYLNNICMESLVDDYNSSLCLVKDKVDFRLNSAPAVWRRKDLMQYTGINDNPWAWEVFGSYRTFGDGKSFYAPCSEKYNIYDYSFKKGGAIYRGKWVSNVVIPKAKKYNLNIDFSERGFTPDSFHEKRTIVWKLKFISLGFKMVGFKAFIFLYRAIKSKI